MKKSVLVSVFIFVVMTVALFLPFAHTVGDSGFINSLASNIGLSSDGKFQMFTSTNSVFLFANPFYTFVKGIVLLSGYFDVRFLGILYLIFTFVALIILFKSIDIQPKYIAWIIYAFSLILLSDLAYLSYFNTLYVEPFLIVLLLFVIGFFFACLTKKTKMSYFLFILCVILLGATSIKSVVFSIVVAILSIFAFDGYKKQLKIFMSILSIAIICVFWTFQGGIPLGIDFMTAIKESLKQFILPITYLSNSFDGFVAINSIWGNFKIVLYKFGVYSPYLWIVFAVIFGYIFTVENNKFIKKISLVFVAIFVNCMFQYILPYAAFYSQNLAQNLTYFNFCFDILFFSSITYITYALARGRREVKEKFGATQ